MPPPSDRNPDEGTRPTSSAGTPQSCRNAPLVIVSERGRHSDESRRIVRAQAARASAAQSRVTRARNREGRDSTVRDGPQSPSISELGQPIESPQSEGAGSFAFEPVQRPLAQWLASMLNLTPSGLLENVQGLATTNPPILGGVTGLLSKGGGALGSALGSVASFGQSSSEATRPQLPLVVPRGFAALQQKVEIPDGFITLVSRTSCFDFGSPGVEERLNQLLYDWIIGHLRVIISPFSQSGHPIQGHLRIACTCLTIFQGQRANGAVIETEKKYQTGLEAAWSEAMLLDQGALSEPKSAEASLWAIFIISVTTGSTAEYFNKMLSSLLQDLQLQHWPDVRKVLLDFIYPVSFLDEPCRLFFNSISTLQPIGIT